jgi:penicillin-binding protein 1A
MNKWIKKLAWMKWFFSWKKFLIASASMFVIVLATILYFYNQVRYVADDLVYYKPSLTTQILDRHGKKIANLFEKEHRLYAKMDEIPPRIVEALVAIEDTMFFEHPGVNIEAILRAIFKDVIARKMVEGASTLTQQLVKNTLLTSEKKISRKIKEAILAFVVETKLTKEEILERYLNEIYLGHGYYGIKTAADGYFHKALHRLTIKEIGMLIGLPKAPSYYDPTRNYEISLGRANRVVTRMHKLGWIDNSSLQIALAERPVVFNESRTQIKAPFVVDQILRELKGRISDIKTGGYIIHTSIDLEMQSIARESVDVAYKEAIERSIEKLKRRSKYQKIYHVIDGNRTQIISDDVNASHFKALNGAMVVTENKTGDILALVGGVDYKTSAFNRATQSTRQPGSSFKPFIYQVALDLGYSSLSPLTDVAKTYEFEVDGEMKKWQPKNYEKDYNGVMNLKEALVHSRNLATINMVTDIGLGVVHKELTERFGFKGLPNDLSLSLGSLGMSVMELSSYYTTFSNYGTRMEGRLITKIEHDGFEPEVFEPIAHEVTTPSQAYLMIDIMRQVVSRGTGRRARVNGIEVAGKTGTTNKAVDAWFCGYTPDIQAMVWFGNDTNKPMEPGETGGRVSGPAFSHFFKTMLEHHPEMKRTFDIPEGVITTRKAGKVEYFTETSQPPQRTAVDTQEAEENLLF